MINTKRESELSFTEIYQEYYRRVYNYAFSRLLHREEAEAYFAKLADVELDEKALRNIAGGTCTLDGTSCWTLSN